jgi:hypothetical protein
VKWIVAEGADIDQTISGGMGLTDHETIERFGTAALLLSLLVRGTDPSWSVDLA